MDFINSIEISNFRSCRETKLEELSNFNVLTGRNNTGKSNVLRALSLFFNDEIEPGEKIDLGRDYSGPKRSRQIVEIELDFSIPSDFGTSRQNRNIFDKIGRKFNIKKIWTTSESGAIEVTGEKANRANDDLTDQGERVINLFNFRYIQAHRDPSDLLSHENEEIMTEILRRYKSSISLSSEEFEGLDDVLEGLSQHAQDYVNPVGERLAEQITGIDSIELDVPSSFSDLALLLGYTLRLDRGAGYSDYLHGSGVQSSLMFQMLVLSDTQYSKYFGSKQGTIWCVEEPECFLHTQLQADLASFFSEAASNNDDYNIQIFSSTHSDIFMQYAPSGYLLSLEEGFSNTEKLHGADLIQKSGLQGITRFDHILLWKRTVPLVFTEGAYDARYLRKTIDVMSHSSRYEIYDLNELSPREEIGGVNHIKKFIKNYKMVLDARPDEAPIIFLFDWDVSEGSIDSLNSLIHDYHENSCALKMNEENSNPELHNTIKGIEKFLPNRIFLSTLERLDIEVAQGEEGGQIRLMNREDYSSRVKSNLIDSFESSATSDDIEYMKNIIQLLDGSI